MAYRETQTHAHTHLILLIVQWNGNRPAGECVTRVIWWKSKNKIWKKNSFLFIYERKILLFNPKFLYKFTPYYIKKHRKNIFVSFILLYSLMNSM